MDPSTVSRVLRNDPAQVVRAETRERILAAAEQLDYRPNGLARALRTRRTDTIALLVHDLENVGFAEVTHGVQAAAEEAGYLVLLGEVPPEEKPGKEGLYTRLVLEGRVDGLLVAFGELGDRLAVELAERNLPLVLVNRRVEGVGASIIADDACGSRMAVDHLVSLGHRRIGHVAGRLSTDTGGRRLRGFREALAGHGLEADGRWIVEGCFTETGGYEAAQLLLDRCPGELPTALYVANLVSGLGALAALREAGLDVPGDISVIVMDEHIIAAHANPPLTTVRMPLFEMGREAVRMLIGAIEGRPPGSVVVDEAPRIVFRESTAPPRSPS